MKYLCVLFLSFFILFLSTPTIIGMFDEKTDTSCFYTSTEEEETENRVSFNELGTVHFQYYLIENFEVYENKKSFFITSNDVSFFNLAHQIFSPPPNKI